MKLTLKIDGENKEFALSGFIPAVIFKKSLQFAHAMDSNDGLDPDLMERLVEFIAQDIYGGQFTPDEFWEGIDSRDFMTVLQQSISAPTFRAQEKLAPLKN
jgi:hypothetical protein